MLYLGAGHDAWAQANAIGLHAGKVAAFDKQAVGVSMAAIGTRSKRYAMAANAADEAASGGFTDGSAPACTQHESADRRNEGGSAAGFALACRWRPGAS